MYMLCVNGPRMQYVQLLTCGDGGVSLDEDGGNVGHGPRVAGVVDGVHPKEDLNPEDDQRHVELLLCARGRCQSHRVTSQSQTVVIWKIITR